MASNRKVSEPPLITDERIETVAATGEKFRVTNMRRGVLGVESRTYNSLSTFMDTIRCEPVKIQLEKLCESLRDRLEHWGLPSDRQPSWVKIRDGDWQPCAADFCVTADMWPVSHSVWSARLEALTEPLTKQRCVGDLLRALTQLLECPSVEPYLPHIARCMSAASALKIAGETNFFATAGIAAHRGRAAGPTAKQQQAVERREAIRPLVSEFWRTSPIHRKDAANTAAALVVSINQVLRDKGLLPRGKKDLSAKTISDYIRALIRGKSI